MTPSASARRRPRMGPGEAHAHPLRTYEDRVLFRSGELAIPSAAVVCVGDGSGERITVDDAIPSVQIVAGHDAMISDVEVLSDALLSMIAGSDSRWVLTVALGLSTDWSPGRSSCRSSRGPRGCSGGCLVDVRPLRRRGRGARQAHLEDFRARHARPRTLLRARVQGCLRMSAPGSDPVWRGLRRRARGGTAFRLCRRPRGDSPGRQRRGSTWQRQVNGRAPAVGEQLEATRGARARSCADEVAPGDIAAGCLVTERELHLLDDRAVRKSRVTHEEGRVAGRAGARAGRAVLDVTRGRVGPAGTLPSLVVQWSDEWARSGKARPSPALSPGSPPVTRRGPIYHASPTGVPEWCPTPALDDPWELPLMGLVDTRSVKCHRLVAFAQGVTHVDVRTRSGRVGPCACCLPGSPVHPHGRLGTFTLTEGDVFAAEQVIVFATGGAVTHRTGSGSIASGHAYVEARDRV